jgi:hypothetical protein
VANIEVVAGSEQVYLLTVKRNGRVYTQSVFTTLHTAHAAGCDWAASSRPHQTYTWAVEAKRLLS